MTDKKIDHIGKIHIVFDVENLSCHTNGHLLSFAAVMFHSEEGWIEGVSFTIEQKRGNPTGHIDPDTVKWWIGQAMQNPEAAMDSFNLFDRGSVPSCTINHARVSFEGWVLEQLWRHLDMHTADLAEAFKTFDMQVWGHSPRVDILQLENTLYGGEFKGPWSFRQENDTRTILNRWKRLHPGSESLWDICDKRAKQHCGGVPHSALRDAYRQAYMVIIDHGWLNRFTPESNPEDFDR